MDKCFARFTDFKHTIDWLRSLSHFKQFLSTLFLKVGTNVFGDTFFTVVAFEVDFDDNIVVLDIVVVVELELVQ